MLFHFVLILFAESQLGEPWTPVAHHFLLLLKLLFCCVAGAKSKELDPLIDDPLFHDMFWEEHDALFAAAASSLLAGTVTCGFLQV